MTGKRIQMAAKAYPDLTVEDWRQFAVAGCSEIGLPYITMDNGYESIALASKWVELVLSNGKCTICGKQIGIATGDPRKFESMDQVKDAYRKQVFYWGEYMAKAEKIFKENQSEWYPAPFCSAFAEGPLDQRAGYYPRRCLVYRYTVSCWPASPMLRTLWE